MKGRINHLMLNVNRYDEAKRFYGWLLPKVGYPTRRPLPKTLPRGGGWYNDDGSVWVQEAEPRFRDHLGLCEIAFTADSCCQVDEPTTEIERHGRRATDAPRQYEYAVFFTDPDGLSWRWCTCHEQCIHSLRPTREEVSRSGNVPEKVVAAAGSLCHEAAPGVEIAKNRHDGRGCSFV
jgi:catechol 2,3-dioxygenase-like lactoylglutathione lyase family enzyme